ncbi:protein-(glutamine-N5) methyltransferase, release factor-specific [Gluconacetobacter diazotrophicus PA1 5]|uniref:Release factor glutamine methyltransferase n=2 Tax=Gluconacetobacter diazotrophicus TaxID=33996 RepID=A9HJ52_GLUDA|nr:peptide chain release factor N(5)-glutamine methyltransferase [Gluconacetobacter diazotrophicus]ACI49939.1 protein-(glutamine-N5) methyltransferase, release factor-specific [Gluconacetobacter diazotrophicus PA1 5]MBB2156490.1 peptide chain release factor N(5)-glutamine methyltransferase [Gluconacetobacter diazotrophicus]TWB05983.1 release factor glutamine methyltransferase [Gluconacetobacter diazotrophicus]CAP55860.1 putative hemK homolog protein [Gluconacetobacter diazotrophicus PA1 5]
MKRFDAAPPHDPADIASLLAWAAGRLAAAGLDHPRREARLLMAHVLRTDLAGLLARSAMDAAEHRSFVALVARRAAHEPMAYITGRAGFWSLDLETAPATLIPRADSETLVEALLAQRPDRGAVRTILDLGTGTGCLLLAALSEYPDAWGLGVDIDPDAAHLAARNARRTGLRDRCAMLAADWSTAIAGRFDVVFSNPPYIPRADLAGLMPDVRDHEPARALDGGTDGLDAYRLLTGALPSLLAHGGIAIFEIGIGQERSMPDLARQAGLDIVGIRTDLGGIPRAVLMQQCRV